MAGQRSMIAGVAFLAAAAVLMVGWLSARVGVSLYVDLLWFSSVGYSPTFLTILKTRAALVLVAFVCTLVAIGINLLIAYRRAPLREHPDFTDADLDPIKIDRVAKALLVLGTVFVSLLVGFSVAANWNEILLYFGATPFDLADPVFGFDVGFFVFRLPAMAYVLKVTFIVWLAVMASTALAYYARGAISISHQNRLLSDTAFSHLSFQTGILALLFALRFWLARYSVLYAKRGAVHGAGYTDVHAQTGAYVILAALSLLLALWLLLNAYWRKRPANVYVLACFVLAWFAVGWCYPAAVQSFIVQPNELTREEPYIRRNIEFTRFAYGLDQIELQSWPGNGALTPEVLAQHPGTIDNLLLWDPLRLVDVYNQRQRIRSYYAFADVDADRYVIDGSMRPVMLSVRELERDQFPPQTQTWTNLHLQYTHGYGLCMSLGNRLVEGGLPDFVVSNIPPESRQDLDVTQPRVYFGESTDDYALTHTRLDEFDYPGDPQNVYRSYDQRNGISVTGTLRRALLAFYTGDKDLFFTNQFTDSSQILLFRRVAERVHKIAPFVYFDSDPYPVLADGKVSWILDGYTLTRRFPYSESVGIANYWRNSVKAVVDAYTGRVDLYLADIEDPIISAYARIFPHMFQPLDNMPQSLRAHLRYPKDMFAIQTKLYCRYHMDDPQVFFNNEDLWTFPATVQDGGKVYEPPRYVLMELPGPPSPARFLLTRSFTVEGKDNMIAWMAAGCDGNDYGKLRVYRLPRGLNIYGPTQAKGRFNQDPDVSAYITLRGQLGSTVFQSMVLPVPVEDGLLYLQSLYVEDPQVRIPEIKQIILGHGDRVLMADEPYGALAKLSEQFSEAPERIVSHGEGTAELRALYNRANDKIRNGDWAGFGAAFDALGAAIGTQENS